MRELDKKRYVWEGGIGGDGYGSGCGVASSPLVNDCRKTKLESGLVLCGYII